MRAPLSVVIPTLNAQGELPGCLEALVEGLRAGIIREVIVSDGGSSDATVRIAEGAGAVIVSGAASRGGQLRRGGEAAQGVWFLFLHADSRLPIGWSDVVAAHFDSDRVGYGRLRFDARGFAPRWVAGWANLRSRLLGLPYGDQGLLISAQTYHDIGGYEDVPLMEDVAIARRLSGRLQMLPMEVTTGAIRYQKAGWFKRGARNLSILVQYFLGASASDLSDRYRR